MEVKIESTFYSDGTRQVNIEWVSKEGERTVLHGLEDLINEYFAKLRSTK